MKKIKFLMVILVFTPFMMMTAQQSQTDTSESKSKTKHEKMKNHNGMNHSNDGDMKSMMQKMHSEMMAFHETGNATKDFAHLMIHHHNGATNMSEKQIAEGKNEELKSISKRIISDSNKDLKELNKYSDAKNESGGKKKEDGMNHGGMKEGMTDMMQKMHKMDSTGDIDQDYASMMIMHHEESIKMAEKYLAKESNGELSSLAKNIIEKSRQDIQDLQQFSK